MKIHPNWYKEDLENLYPLPPRKHLYDTAPVLKGRTWPSHQRNGIKAGPQPKRALRRGTISSSPAVSDIVICPECNHAMTGLRRGGCFHADVPACLRCDPKAQAPYCPPKTLTRRYT